MRTFNWNKLPVSKIWGKKNIWSLVVKKNEKSNPNTAKIDFNDMESLFCQQAPAAPKASGGKDASKEASANDDQRKKKDEVGVQSRWAAPATFCHL
jgi:hypothetical protein